MLQKKQAQAVPCCFKRIAVPVTISSIQQVRTEPHIHAEYAAFAALSGTFGSVYDALQAGSEWSVVDMHICWT
jgi:hypothetical protein